jgi:transcriptional regulator with XRE-family HTH domain
MNSELTRLVAQTVEMYRLEAGFTQADLAERSGLSLARISEIESGEGIVTIQILERIANVLAVGVPLLLCHPDMPRPRFPYGASVGAHCGGCRFYDELVTQEEILAGESSQDVPTGFCKRHAPSPYLAVQGKHYADVDEAGVGPVWPIVSVEDQCGDYAARVDVQSWLDALAL